MITKLENVNADNLRKEMQAIADRMHLPHADEALLFPKYFQIETTRLCNARCPFCAIDQWDKSVPMMSDELFEKIVREMANYSDWIEFVAVQRAGEPLLDKKIVARVRALKEVGIKKVSMSTNASMLSEKKSIALLEAGLDEMMLSIDSIDKSTYQKMRVGLDYDTVIRNIRNFFLVRDRIKPNVIVRVRGVSFHHIEEKSHREEMNRWERFWDEIRKPQDRIYLKRAHNWGNQISWKGHLPEFDSVFHPCILPWSTMHVTSMGKVPLCPQDYDAKMDIGDVNVHSIADIWKNENWTRIRKLHKTGQRNQISFCQGCKLFDPENSLEKWQEKQLYEA